MTRSLVSSASPRLRGEHFSRKIVIHRHAEICKTNFRRIKRLLIDFTLSSHLPGSAFCSSRFSAIAGWPGDRIQLDYSIWPRTRVEIVKSS